MANKSFDHSLLIYFSTYQTFVTNLHLLRVELRCKLQEKLHRVTGPLVREEKINTTSKSQPQSLHKYLSSASLRCLSARPRTRAAEPNFSSSLAFSCSLFNLANNAWRSRSLKNWLFAPSSFAINASFSSSNLV